MNSFKKQTTMNSIVFSQGEPSDAVYIVKSGIFEVKDSVFKLIYFLFLMFIGICNSVL